MKAVGLTEFGGPEVLKTLEVDEPHAGEGQVRGNIEAFDVTPPILTFAQVYGTTGTRRQRTGKRRQSLPRTLRTTFPAGISAAPSTKSAPVPTRKLAIGLSACLSIRTLTGRTPNTS